jgi:hypothetical protein
MIRTFSTLWTSWGMPPRKGEGERPPVPPAPTWYAVDVVTDGPRPTPSTPPSGWYWMPAEDGYRFMFRSLADARRFEADQA